ncbi:hypothetical protein GJ496_001284 [Pomphorhynchus laevis]|nr:hypothetical protein GJ496_001284 [Pomphorhynchus laevis]
MISRLINYNLMKQQRNISMMIELRKRTGYLLSKCREASLKFTDIDEAHKWLDEQAKKDGLQRITRRVQAKMHNTVGLVIKRNHAHLIKISCESDFVSNSDKYREFVRELLHAYSAYNTSIGSNKFLNKTSSEQLLQIPMLYSDVQQRLKTIASEFKETLCISDGIHISTDLNLGAYVHGEVNSANVYEHGAVGKAVAVVVVDAGENVVQNSDQSNISEMCNWIAQHIVGKHPLTIGNISSYIDSLTCYEKDVSQPEILSKGLLDDQEGEESELADYDEDVLANLSLKNDDSNESRLIFQRWIYAGSSRDPESFDFNEQVGSFLVRNHLTVRDFVRSCTSSNQWIVSEHFSEFNLKWYFLLMLGTSFTSNYEIRE